MPWLKGVLRFEETKCKVLLGILQAHAEGCYKYPDKPYEDRM